MHCKIIDCYFNIFFVEIQLEKQNWKNVIWGLEFGCPNWYLGVPNGLDTSQKVYVESRKNSDNPGQTFLELYKILVQVRFLDFSCLYFSCLYFKIVVLIQANEDSSSLDYFLFSFMQLFIFECFHRNSKEPIVFYQSYYIETNTNVIRFYSQYLKRIIITIGNQ